MDCKYSSAVLFCVASVDMGIEYAESTKADYG